MVLKFLLQLRRKFHCNIFGHRATALSSETFMVPRSRPVEQPAASWPSDSVWRNKSGISSSWRDMTIAYFHAVAFPQSYRVVQVLEALQLAVGPSDQVSAEWFISCPWFSACQYILTPGCQVQNLFGCVANLIAWMHHAKMFQKDAPLERNNSLLSANEKLVSLG